MGCWRNKFLQRRSSNFKEDKHLTVDEMIDALESVLGGVISAIGLYTLSRNLDSSGECCRSIKV